MSAGRSELVAPGPARDDGETKGPAGRIARSRLPPVPATLQRRAASIADVVPGGNMLRIAFAFAVLATSRAALAADPPPIRIGQVIPITGEAAESGRYHKYGAELAVEQVNKSGGIKGRKIELVQEDDKTTNPGAVTALQRLLEDKEIPAIVGSIRSTQVQA